MVNSIQYQQHLSETFAALAHPIRRGILERLALGDASVGELAEPFKVTPPAITKHLRILEDAGLLARRKNGSVHRCSISAAPMKDATDWIEQYRKFWTVRLDALDRYLKANKRLKRGG